MVYLRYSTQLIIFLSLCVFHCGGQKLVLVAILRIVFGSCILHAEKDMFILGNGEGYISSNNTDSYKYFLRLLLCDAFQDLIFFSTQRKDMLSRLMFCIMS